MNLQKIAVQILIVLIFVTAIPAAYSQQGNLRGPKNATPRYSEPQRQQQQQPQQQRQPQTQLDTQSGTYGPIVPADTLWQISRNYRPNSSLSIYQVMQAIYELNPTAFEKNNINLMISGSILRMPPESYIANINSRQAQQRSERDSLSLQSDKSSQLLPEVTNAAALDQTKELIEQKLGAIDEAQNRQFMAIRKQFAESISGVQSILDENQNLFERLGKVNTDIDEMRIEEQQKTLQMNQMGESIKELLEKSRQDDAEKAAQMAEKDNSWLDSPITLILLATLPVLLILSAFAYWMIKRKAPAVIKPEEDDVDDLSLDPLAAEMDDLSDALSAELSAESGDELDDDNLFGDDDLLDDVLSEELEESLDDALEDSIEEPLVDDSDNFDDLGDDILEDEFEVGAEVVEQDDLDSLFDEDDDLLAEVDEEISAEISEDLADDLLAEIQDSDDSSGIDEMLIEEDEQQVAADIDDMEYEEDDSLLAPVEADNEIITESVEDEEDQPEISIDELLNDSEKETIENSLIDDSEEINEEALQNLDKEIATQNEELDSVTGSLIDELEQVEQMRSMLPDDDDEELSDVEDPQLDIQKLDDLAEEVDEGLLTDGFGDEETDDAVEIDISEVLNEAIQPIETEELVEPGQVAEVEESVEPEQVAEVEESVEPEQVAAAEESVEPEQVAAAEESVEPEQVAAAEESVEPEQAAAAEESVEPEQVAEVEESVEPEQVAEIAESVEPEQAAAAEESVEPEKVAEVEESVEPEQAAEVEESVEPEQVAEIAESVEPEKVAEVAESVEPEQVAEVAESVEPEQAAEVAESVEPEQVAEITESVEPEQAAEVAESVESEQAVEAEESVEPEQVAEVAESVEPEQAVDDSIDEEHEFDIELDAEAPANNDSTLDEDQLEKALEDFEKEELDEVLEDLTSNENASISSLDDLEFSADDFVTKDQPNEPISKPLPTLDDIGSIDDFDDSELDNAFDETLDSSSDNSSNESSQNSSDELDDLPGLGDWLDEDEAKPDTQQISASEDKDIIDELEESSFDEMLESIDLDDDLLESEEDDTGFDIAALLDETPQDEHVDVNELDTNDFLDVEALLNESVDAESDDEIDKALDLDIPLEPFVNEQDNLEMIDVDANDGLGAKLDLAHAYIEIGEEESAKELLDEILKKGSAEQIAEVKTILDKLD
jgi:pilus assembly protein FimV